MYKEQPLNIEGLTCRICGKLAKWYDREFHSTYVLGEALCNTCVNHYRLYTTTPDTTTRCGSVPGITPSLPPAT